MKKPLYTFMAIVGLIASCQKEEVQPSEFTSLPNPYSSSLIQETSCEETFDLFGGQTIWVGEVSISNDDNYIYVTYNTSGGWVINETHLYIGDPNGIPSNNAGNPQLGQFPYNESHTGVTSHTIIVPIDPNLECYVVAAHASVSLLDENGIEIQQETAWSSGNQINEGGSWATYSDYCLLECGCEYDVISFDYYGGQNILMGTLDVTNDENFLYVTFNFTGDWHMGQTHLFVGDVADIPTNNAGNPIPGQFPYAESHHPAVQAYTYTISLDELDSCYAIAAHTEAELHDVDGNVIQTETGWSHGTEFNGNSWGWYSEYCTQICE